MQSNAPTNTNIVVTKLLSDITSNTYAALKQYNASGQPLPPPSSTTPHILDSVDDNLELKKSLCSLYDACNKLCMVLATPTCAIGESIKRVTEPACLRVVVEAGIADVLLDFPAGLPFEELSKKVPHIDQGKLTRTVKYLISIGYFQEVSPGIVTNNRLSLGLLSSDPLSAAVCLWGDEQMKGLAGLYETFTDPDSAFSYSTDKSSISRALKGDEQVTDMFALYATPEHARRGERFGRSMLGWTKILGSVPALKYPLWNELKAGSTVCDVGSGIGAFTLRLAKTYPHLNVILSDLPEVVEQAKEYWGKEYKEALDDSGRVSFISSDFFKEIPKSADVYYLRHILHDWDDSDAQKILSTVKDAMSPGSKLLIHDLVIPEQNDGLGEDFKPAASMIYHFDVAMLSFFNSRERTRRQCVNLCSNVGLKLTKTVNLAETSILEFSISTCT